MITRQDRTGSSHHGCAFGIRKRERHSANPEISSRFLKPIVSIDRTLLGLKPFTPHDLRRTAATLAGDLGFDDAWIAKWLEHSASKKSGQIVPSVTGKVYNHSKRMKKKRAVLDGVATDHRRTIRHDFPLKSAYVWQPETTMNDNTVAITAGITDHC